MGQTLAAQIESYIKRLLELSADNSVELSRADLAQMFMCVPSQINYVLSTRFGSEAGYYIETRRGGSGYVRIIRTELASAGDLTRLLEEARDKSFSRQGALNLLTRLRSAEIISAREEAILKAMLAGDALRLNGKEAGGEQEDLLRGRLIRLLLMNLIRDDIE